MKEKGFVIAVLLLLSSGVIYSAPVFPPELTWWISEASKVNKGISVEAFKQIPSQSTTIQSKNKVLTPTFPVFIRWNFTATKYAYFNDGLLLSKNKDGRYSVKNEAGTAFYIADNKNRVIFEEHYGQNIEIDGVSWLRDDTVVSVSHIINLSEISEVDLYISQYKITDTKVEVTTYEFESAFNFSDLEELRINWWQQRSDYFTNE